MSLDTARAITNLRSLTQKFDQGAESASPFYPSIATVVNSGGADEEYGGLGSVPGVREWLGDRQFNTLRAGKFTIENRKWESSIQIEKDDIDDARLVKYGPVLEQLGVEAMHHPDELMFELLVAGESGLCFDGQAFFDTDHVWGESGTQSNDLTYAAATGTVPTAAEFRLAYHQARTAMFGFKRDNGKYFHRPTLAPMSDLLLLVSPAEELTAVEALTKDLTGGGDTNIILDRPKIVAVPYLAAGKFYLLKTGGSLKPLIFQARQPLSRQMKGMEDREFKDVKFMVDARYNCGYLAWWNAVLTTWT
jgi:phage major head subunit gpT-like protein